MEEGPGSRRVLVAVALSPAGCHTVGTGLLSPGEEECGKRHVWGFEAVFTLPCALPSDVVVGSCTSGILPKAPRGTLGTLVHGDLGLLEPGEAELFIFQPPKLSNTQWCCWRKSWFCSRGCLAILCAPGELFRIKIIHN